MGEIKSAQLPSLMDELGGHAGRQSSGQQGALWREPHRARQALWPLAVFGGFRRGSCALVAVNHGPQSLAAPAESE